jgi:hypothetical protein
MANLDPKSVTLIVAMERSSDDLAAIRLVKEGGCQYQLVERRQPSLDEPLPTLWTREYNYCGLARIESFVMSRRR